MGRSSRCGNAIIVTMNVHCHKYSRHPEMMLGAKVQHSNNQHRGKKKMGSEGWKRKGSTL